MTFRTTSACVLLLAAVAAGQDGARSLLDAARKRVEATRGRTGDELAQGLKEAAELLEQVAKKHPAAKTEIGRADLELGRVRKRLGDASAAEEAFKRASAAEETRVAAEALHELAGVYKKQKKLGEAQAALERVVAEFGMEPRERAEAFIRLAGLHRAGKRPQEAETALLRVLAEHADLYACAVEALDDPVALKLSLDQDAEARKAFDAHAEGLKTRYVGGRNEARLQTALDRIQLRLKKSERDDGPK